MQSVSYWLLKSSLISLPFFVCCFREYEESEAIATVHEALKQGINYIDTAPWYGQGRSEELLGKVPVSPLRIVHYTECDERKRDNVKR
jgi:Predicted oxidoreductases (related to aryl-alcohol dehydrogenases)